MICLPQTPVEQESSSHVFLAGSLCMKQHVYPGAGYVQVRLDA
jgi:hypothetical protein